MTTSPKADAMRHVIETAAVAAGMTIPKTDGLHLLEAANTRAIGMPDHIMGFNFGHARGESAAVRTTIIAAIDNDGTATIFVGGKTAPGSSMPTPNPVMIKQHLHAAIATEQMTNQALDGHINLPTLQARTAMIGQGYTREAADMIKVTTSPDYNGSSVPRGNISLVIPADNLDRRIAVLPGGTNRKYPIVNTPNVHDALAIVADPVQLGAIMKSASRHMNPDAAARFNANLPEAVRAPSVVAAIADASAMQDRARQLSRQAMTDAVNQSIAQAIG